jgi:hypothetical protein
MLTTRDFIAAVALLCSTQAMPAVIANGDFRFRP